MTLRYAHLATNDLAQCAAALDARNADAAGETAGDGAPGSPGRKPANQDHHIAPHGTVKKAG